VKDPEWELPETIGDLRQSGGASIHVGQTKLGEAPRRSKRTSAAHGEAAETVRVILGDVIYTVSAHRAANQVLGRSPNRKRLGRVVDHGQRNVSDSSGPLHIVGRLREDHDKIIELWRRTDHGAEPTFSLPHAVHTTSTLAMEVGHNGTGVLAMGSRNVHAVPVTARRQRHTALNKRVCHVEKWWSRMIEPLSGSVGVLKLPTSSLSNGNRLFAWYADGRLRGLENGDVPWKERCRIRDQLNPVFH